MTTLRQPLVQLGHASVTMLFEQIQHQNNGDNGGGSRTLWAELIVRKSTAPAPTGAAR
jgi:DNA-binding LacI/PurR family transcriptional regulator